MTDTNKHSHNIAVPPITRNGITKTLSKLTFGKRSNSAGHSFYAPEFSQATMADDLTWAGADWVTSVLNKRARVVFMDIWTYHAYEDTTDEKGAPVQTLRATFPIEEYIKDIQDFTEGEAKLSELREDYMAMVEVQQELVQKSMDDPENSDKYIQEVQNNNPAIITLKKQIASLESKWADRAAKREAAKKAKEAASKTVGATA
jgi:hypothetical protein